jgi:hypothetical protein
MISEKTSTWMKERPHNGTADFTECADKGMGRTMIHEELSREIIGASMTVLNTLKPGLDEKLYEQALCIELRALGHDIEQQRRFPVIYRDLLINFKYASLKWKRIVRTPHIWLNPPAQPLSVLSV